MFAKSPSWLKRVLFAFPIALSFASCEQHIEQDTPLLVVEDSKYVIVILFDLSGSFEEFMTKDGKGWNFALKVIDTYFRNRMGENDRLILAQISGTQQALLWDGKPMALRQSFPSAQKFREFLQSKSNPGGSRVHLGVIDALQYAMSYPGVQTGKSKSAVFVLSDFVDNAPDSDESKKRLVRTLETYGKQGGIVGFYYVDQSLFGEWQRHIGTAGVKGQVTSQIVVDPPLPNFD